MAVTVDEQLTIDQLAQRTGMTVRNIRAHQSRGLLPPPDVRGRTGYYGPEHAARIELIKELQGEGFSLELIGRLLESAGGSSNEVLRFSRALREPFGDEEPQIVEAAELARRWESTDPGLLRRGEQLGVLRSLGDNRFELPSPRLARAADELLKLGVPISEALDIYARLRRHADGVARTFTDVFLGLVWKPFEEAGRPPERWQEVSESLERLHPLAADSLLAIFQLAMDDAVERVIGRELEKELERARRRSRKRSGRR